MSEHVPTLMESFYYRLGREEERRVSDLAFTALQAEYEQLLVAHTDLIAELRAQHTRIGKRVADRAEQRLREVINE